MMAVTKLISILASLRYVQYYSAPMMQMKGSTFTGIEAEYILWFRQEHLAIVTITIVNFDKYILKFWQTPMQIKGSSFTTFPKKKYKYGFKFWQTPMQMKGSSFTGI